ncbi:MAG: lipopolysaccharide biosynthesis protein [Bacteroidota bacterium]
MASLKEKSINAFVWDISGTLITHGSSFIISIVLARLLSPSEFGLIGMVMVFVTISQVFVDAGFSSSIIQEKDISETLCNSIFLINILTGIFLSGVFYLSAGPVSDFYQIEELEILVQYFSVIFIINSFNIVQVAILTRELNFKALTIRQVISNVIGGIVGIILAYLNYGVFSLVAQKLVAASISTLLLWSLSSWTPKFEFSKMEIKKIFGFSSSMFFDKLLFALSNQVNILGIGKLFSPSTLGFYTRAQTLNELVIKYSSTSLNKVLYPVLSKLQADSDEFYSLYIKTVNIAVFLSFLIGGILLILSEPLIISLFGEKWQPSIFIFQCLLLATCNHPVNSMVAISLISKGYASRNFKIGIYRKVLKLVPLVIAYLLGFNAFIYSFICVDYFLLIVNILISKYYLGFPIKDHLLIIKDGLISLLLGILMYNYFSNASVYLLTLFYMLIYLGINLIFRNKALFYLLNHFLNFIQKNKNL